MSVNVNTADCRALSQTKKSSSIQSALSNPVSLYSFNSSGDCVIMAIFGFNPCPSDSFCHLSVAGLQVLAEIHVNTKALQFDICHTVLQHISNCLLLFIPEKYSQDWF